MPERCLRQPNHLLVVLSGPILFLDQFPGPVEATGREVPVGLIGLEVSIVCHHFSKKTATTWSV
jgi:hypothetical protein